MSSIVGCINLFFRHFARIHGEMLMPRNININIADALFFFFSFIIPRRVTRSRVHTFARPIERLHDLNVQNPLNPTHAFAYSELRPDARMHTSFAPELLNDSSANPPAELRYFSGKQRNSGVFAQFFTA